MLRIIQKKYFPGLLSLCEMPHLASNFVHLTTRKEGEIKEDKVKRKQGGKRSKNSGVAEIKRDTEVMVMDRADRKKQ